jgi:hypothetical protein
MILVPQTKLTENETLVREQYGFRRTACGCAFCQAPCRHVPGSLDPADLPRLCPRGQDVFAWAEQHLRALPDKPFPTLVPVRQPNGHCHWYYSGRCAVHENAPYSCAFFDTHLTDHDVQRRSAATIQARRKDRAAKGLYYRVWLHLCREGLTAGPGDRSALVTEWKKMQQNSGRR